MADTEQYYKIDDAVPTVTATPVTTVSVVAPSNLAEGYLLDTVVNGQNVKVQVPSGGVKEGQQFTATVVSGTVADPHNVPHGSWRDGLCNCFAQGPCHPSLCLTCWCAPLSLAQVMTRMKLNWCGQQKGTAAASKTFLYVAVIFLSYLAIDQVLDMLMLKYAPTEEETYGNGNNNGDYVVEYSSSWWAIYSVRVSLRLVFFLYFLMITIRTRQTVRNKYDIPTQQCGGCEDCCCSYWCSCCTISQMSRHTADYDSYPASCCNSTGLNPSAPEVV